MIALFFSILFILKAGIYQKSLSASEESVEPACKQTAGSPAEMWPGPESLPGHSAPTDPLRSPGLGAEDLHKHSIYTRFFRPQHYIYIYIYIYSFSRRFYPKRLPRKSFTIVHRSLIITTRYPQHCK